MPDAPPRCDPTSPFAAPVAVTELNTSLDDASARLSEDELTIMFARRQTGGIWDLYQATRTARDAPFGAPELLATVNSVNSELWPTLSPDGLTLLFDSDRGQPGTYRIHVARRASTAERFSGAAPLAGLLDREIHAYFANASAVYFSSPSTARPGEGGSDIWRVGVNGDGTLSAPAAIIGGINTSNEEVTPALTPDELRMYFRRTVMNEPDIYAAQRSTTNDGWGAAMPVLEVSVMGVNEVPTWISPDNCTLYLFSDASGGAGGFDLYVAYRGSP